MELDGRADRARQWASVRYGLALVAAMAASPAPAEREFCPERPGVGTPPCTMEPGKVSVELSLADRTWDREPDAHSDAVLAGDVLFRLGIADHAEVRIAWTPYGFGREHDLTTGEIERTSGVGDMVVGIKRNIVDPEGKRFSVALLGSVNVPTGRYLIGEGDWGASLSIPFSLPVVDGVSLGLTPEFDAAVDEDRHGRHPAYGMMGGFTIQPVEKLAIAVEMGAMRDEDPEEAATEWLAALSFGLMLDDDTQIDAATEIGLNHAAPDSRLYIGISRRF